MNEELKSITLKNKLIQPLIDLLEGPLPSIQARARNRFVTTLGMQLVVIDTERRRLFSEAADKDENGKPKTKKITNPSNGQEVEIFDLTPEASKKVGEELTTFLDEEYVIDILPSNRFEIEVVTRAVLNTTKEFGLVDGAQYDLIAQEFEKYGK